MTGHHRELGRCLVCDIYQFSSGANAATKYCHLTVDDPCAELDYTSEMTGEPLETLRQSAGMDIAHPDFTAPALTQISLPICSCVQKTMPINLL